MRNASFLMGSQAVTWTLGLVVAVALPRHLGPAVLGQLRLGLSLWAVAAILVAFGTQTLLIKEFARDRTAAASMLGPATTLQLAAYAASWLGVALFTWAAGYGPDTLVVIGIVGASVGFAPLSGSARGALYGLERMDLVGFADVVTKLLYVGLVLTLIALGAGVRGFAAASVVTGATSAAVMLYFLRRAHVRWGITFAGVRETARRSRSYMMSDVALVAYQQIDIIVISLLVREEALGWYSTADGLFGSLLFVPTILMTTMFPVFSRLHVADPTESSRLLQRSFRLLVVIAVPIGLGTLALATPASLLLFGEQFAQTGAVLAVMGLVLTLTYLTILLGRYAIAIDRQEFWIKMMLVATAATVALDVVLVPWAEQAIGNGAVGGALAYLVTESVMLGVGLWKVAPDLLCRATAVRVTKCALAGAAMVGAVWPLRPAFILLPVVAGAVSYSIVLAALRALDTEEVEMLRSGSRRLLARLTNRGTAGSVVGR